MLTLLFLVLYPVYYGLFYFFMRRPRECTSIQFLDKKLKYNTLLFLLFFFFMELLLLSTVNVWRSNFTSLATATSTLFSYVLLVNHTIKVFRLLYWDSLLYSFTSSFFTETMCTTRTIRNSKSDTPFSSTRCSIEAVRLRSCTLSSSHDASFSCSRYCFSKISQRLNWDSRCSSVQW